MLKETLGVRCAIGQIRQVAMRVFVHMGLCQDSINKLLTLRRAIA